MRYTVILFSLLLLGFAGCKEDDGIIPPGNTSISANDVLVINEGNFQRGNAGIGLYNTISNEYKPSVFKNANGYPIGDVLQSLTLINGEYWAVINNSGKILVLDSVSLEVRHEIKGFTSPRYVAANENGTKVFVTDLYADEVAVVDAGNYSISNFIPLAGWTDHLVMTSGELWVTNREYPYVYIIDVASEQVTDSVACGNNSNSIRLLGNNVIAVLSEGKLNSSEKALMQFIRVSDRKMLKTYTFEGGEKPNNIRENPVSGEVYVAYEGIHTFDIAGYNYQGKLLDLPGQFVYGFDIDPATGNLYISDAKDFVENSEVQVYSKDGELKHSFTAGNICNGFVFR